MITESSDERNYSPYNVINILSEDYTIQSNPDEQGKEILWDHIL